MRYWEAIVRRMQHELAPVARQGQQALGRGAVVLRFPTRPALDGLLVGRMAYAPYTENTMWDTATAEMLRTYDASTMYVVMIVIDSTDELVTLLARYPVVRTALAA